MVPPTKYARSGDINIAYQVFGAGPVDLVVVPGWVSNIDVFWEEPTSHAFSSGSVRFRALSCSTSAALAFQIGSPIRRCWKSAWTTCAR